MTNMFYAVDPGKKRSAVAAFRANEFVGVWFASDGSMEMKENQVGSVAMEMPQSYPSSAVPPQDLLDLAAAGMAVSARLAKPLSNIRLIKPSEWKGQVPKNITQKRIERFLTMSERICLERCLQLVTPSLRHNLYDAVGLGLFALKRVKRGIA